LLGIWGIYGALNTEFGNSMNKTFMTLSLKTKAVRPFESTISI